MMRLVRWAAAVLLLIGIVERIPAKLLPFFSRQLKAR